MSTNSIPWQRPRQLVYALYNFISLMSVTFDQQWFRKVDRLGLDVIIRRMVSHEVTVVVSLPLLFRWSITLASLHTSHHGVPSIRETGFEISSQHIRLSWQRALVGKVRDGGFYWISLWRDILGVRYSRPYVIRVLDAETHHYYKPVGHEEYRVHRVEVEAVLYGQRVQGNWWCPITMEKRWVEVSSSEPIQTRMGVVKHRVYPANRGRFVKAPLDAFRAELLEMSLPE